MKLFNKIYRKLLIRSALFQRVAGAFAGKDFRREVRAVYAGIAAHDQATESLEGFAFRLRRNTHRLEKGLTMEPRRDVFAVNYIEETVDAYENLHDVGFSTDDELKWFHDVLEEYFAVTGDNKVINACRERFNKITKKESGISQSTPVRREDFAPTQIAYDDFFTLCRLRRSVRWYSDQPVPRGLVDQALLAAAQSPSACNRQPFEFRIFDDPTLIAKVSTIPMGTRGFAHQFPMIIVVVGKLNAYEYERDRHLIYIDGSLAAMSFMLALETLGLSSCPINWPDIGKNETKMAKVLKLKSYERPVMLISVGYARNDGLIPFSQKKELDKLRRYN